MASDVSHPYAPVREAVLEQILALVIPATLYGRTETRGGHW